MSRVPHVEVDIFEPLTPGQRQSGSSRVVYLHLFATCPSVRRAVRRDGEVLHSRGFLDAALAEPPALPLCGWCAHRLVAQEPWLGLEWFNDHRSELRGPDARFTLTQRSGDSKDASRSVASEPPKPGHTRHDVTDRH